ncbi:MAG: hypothetical protein ACQCN3_00760 [Candidatus Bathyarchaeia archaeon]|jgi:predicted phage tail protein
MYKFQVPKIKLSPFSTIRACAEGATTKAQNWKDELVDAGALAGLAFFTTLGGTTATSGANFEAALIAAGVSFFSILCMKRKLVREA